MAGQSLGFLGWKYSHYFEHLEEKEKGVVSMDSVFYITNKTKGTKAKTLL